MSLNELILTIGIMCGIKLKDSEYGNNDLKTDCVEFYTNCMIGPNGVILDHKLGECSKEWKKRRR